MGETGWTPGLLSQCHWRLVAETEAARRQLAMVVVKSILDCLLYDGDGVSTKLNCYSGCILIYIYIYTCLLIHSS